MNAMLSSLTVIGIDVGGARKGLHAVALRDGKYHAQMASRDAEALVAWCVEKMAARWIAVDAPCRWRPGHETRAAERELNRQGIRCFFTPTRAKAVAHPKNYYGWMLQGEAVFAALERTHPLATPTTLASSPGCFETYPHAITWHLRGGSAEVKEKRAQRLALLQQCGVSCEELRDQDLIDSALCALVAHQALNAKPMHHYGDFKSGLIWVPERVRITETPYPSHSRR